MSGRVLVLAIVVLAGAMSANPETVEIVVDGSAGGWRRGSDDRPLADASRRLLLDLSGRLAALASPPTVRLRWIGGLTDGSADDCLAVDDVVILDPTDPAGLAADVDRRTPAGQRPLIRAIEAARASDADRVVVVTTGPDSCGGLLSDLAPVADGDPPIEIVALEVRPTAFGTLPEGVRNRVVVLGASGADALARAVLPDDSKGPRDAAIELVGRAGDTLGDDDAGTAIHALSGESFDMFRRRDGRLVARVPPGPYRVRADLAGGAIEICDLVAASGSETSLAVALPPRFDLEPRITLTVATSELAVRVLGEHDRPLWLSVAPAESPLDMVATATLVPAGERDAVVLVPDIAGNCEVRAYLEDPAGYRIVVARHEILVRPTGAEVITAERAEIATPLDVELHGPGFPGDAIAVAIVDTPATESATCRPAGTASHLELTTPQTPGSYEVRYLSGLTGRVLARTALEVFEILARLDTPAEVSAGSRFEVGWDGPDAAGDFLTIVAPGTPPGEYRELVLTASGNPATLQAPATGGEWEIRYVDGATAAILGQSTIAVSEAAPSLAAPATVSAGARFEVVWTGPDRDGDFIAVAPVNTPARRHEDFAYTSIGSPAALAAPFRPGEYEVRYVDGASGTVLAQRPLSVQ